MYTVQCTVQKKRTPNPQAKKIQSQRLSQLCYVCCMYCSTLSIIQKNKIFVTVIVGSTLPNSCFNVHLYCLSQKTKMYSVHEQAKLVSRTFSFSKRYWITKFDIRESLPYSPSASGRPMTQAGRPGTPGSHPQGRGRY